MCIYIYIEREREKYLLLQLCCFVCDCFFSVCCSPAEGARSLLCGAGLDPRDAASMMKCC